MSTAAKGNARCDAVAAQLCALGYLVALIKASGRRGTTRRILKTIAADLIAFAPADTFLPHVVIEVGGAGKRLARTFAALPPASLPGGFIALIAVCRNRRWHFYRDGSGRFATLEAALEWEC